MFKGMWQYWSAALGAPLFCIYMFTLMIASGALRVAQTTGGY